MILFVGEINKDNIRNNIFVNEYFNLLTDDKFIIQNLSSNALKFFSFKILTFTNKRWYNYFI